MTTTRPAALVILACLLAAARGWTGEPGAPGDQEFSQADSSFQAGESHETARVERDEKRSGWTEQRDTVRFGAYSLTVTQRLDPATGFPPPERRWGDAFVGILGKRPAFYMSSNWSPWDFLSARVRLAGEGKELPDLTVFGRLAFCGLREQTSLHIVADAIWEDAHGGFLRARLVGWRAANRFGLSLRYTPPPGARVESLAYSLVCQPYDLADRGYWERRRWVQTPLRGAPTGKEPLVFDPAVEGQFVFYNRNAQNTAGCVLAVRAPSVRSMAVSGEYAMRIDLAPADVDGETVLVLGDWVDEPYALAAAAFFADARAVGEELARTVASRVPKPERLPAADAAEIDQLLATHPRLAAAFGDRLRETRARAAGAWAAFDVVAGPEPSPGALKAVGEARRAWEGIHREIRCAWVKEKLFAPPGNP